MKEPIIGEDMSIWPRFGGEDATSRIRAEGTRLRADVWRGHDGREHRPGGGAEPSCPPGSTPEANGNCSLFIDGRVVVQKTPDQWDVGPIDFFPENPRFDPVQPPAAPPPVALAAPTSTVTGDVDVYDVPGGVGTVVGMLSAGQQVTKNCRSDNWCEVPGQGWVWGDFLG